MLSEVLRRFLFIQTQTTPSPDAMKFLPGLQLLPEGQAFDFPSPRAAVRSPLAARLWGVDGVGGVFIGTDFITVTKVAHVDWALLRPDLFEAISDFVASGEPAFRALEGSEVDTGDGADEQGEDSEVVALIKELIESRVRPAVAEDGGNIVYRGFDQETGIVDLELQGACSSCSSSSVTLKMGVENMLKHYIPEVKAVREVKGKTEKESDEALSELETKLSRAGVLRS